MQLEESDEVALHLPDGQVVLKSGKVMKPVAAPAVRAAQEIKNGRQAVATLERVHRKLGDLPEQAEKMNAIACVLMYTSVGLSNGDIATALRTTEANVERLKDLEAYKQLAEMFDSTVFEDSKRTANHIISRASSNAAQRIVDFAGHEDASIALPAAREVVRMAGVGVNERDNEKSIGSLNIKITRTGDKKDEDITVEINP